MSGIIHNACFTYFYPPFKPRLWILYEVTEHLLTCSGGIGKIPHIEPFLQRTNEMIEKGVQKMLAEHHLSLLRRSRQTLPDIMDGTACSF